MKKSVMNRNVRRSCWSRALALLCCAALLLLALLPGALADPAPILLDDADLLTAAEEAALLDVMRPICEYGTPVFWSTQQAGEYRSKAENKYFQLLGNASGIMFVVDMAQRQLTILADGAIYTVVTTSEAETITDNVYRMASRGDYAACAAEVFRQAYALLRGEQIARPMKLVSNVLLALTLALMIVYLYIHRRYETRPMAGKAGAALPVTAAGAAAFTAVLTSPNILMTKQQRINLSSSSHGGGGHHGGGGGHSGGGFSGGGGSHGF